MVIAGYGRDILKSGCWWLPFPAEVDENSEKILNKASGN